MKAVMKIIIPDFNEINYDEEAYEIRAEVNGKEAGRYNCYFYSRYNLIDETEGSHEDFNFFARQLELYETRYLNDEGEIVMIIDNFWFDKNYGKDYLISFISDSVSKIIDILSDDLADIYALVDSDDLEIYANSNFKFIAEDSEYGSFMHLEPII